MKLDTQKSKLQQRRMNVRAQQQHLWMTWRSILAWRMIVEGERVRR